MAAIRPVEYHLFRLVMETAGMEAKSTTSIVGSAGTGLKDLTSLRVFARVVELQSFSEVARRSGVTPATISKHVSSLEGQLGARLVNRTTRRLFITEAGQRLYEHCVRIMQELDQAEAEVAEVRGEPAGPLRVTAPMLFGLLRIAPRLPEFARQYPKVSIDLDLSVEKIDLFQERIDVAVRIAEAIDPGLVAFRLAPYRRVFCASPAYLAAHGTPRTPEDLAHHNCLVSRGPRLTRAGRCGAATRSSRCASTAISWRTTARSCGRSRWPGLAS